jgi:hypothetical protein
MKTEKERDLWFWMKEFGHVLDGSTDEELAALRREYLVPGSTLVVTMARQTAKRGHVRVKSALRVGDIG